MLPLTIAIVTALATLGAGYGGAHLANQGAERQQQQQITEERDVALRQKRADVYGQFLNDSSRYQLATQRLASACADEAGNVANECEDPMSDWLGVRNEFQNSVNRVYIWGSKDAWTTVTAITGDLPPAIGSPDETSPTLTGFPKDTFGQHYNDFLADICADVQTGTSSNCG